MDINPRSSRIQNELEDDSGEEKLVLIWTFEMNLEYSLLHISGALIAVM
jgi:hypothetical protein